MKFTQLSAAAVFAIGSLIAQGPRCPFERAEEVPASWNLGPSVDCQSGIDMQIGGIQVKSNKKGCPLFVTITPTHEVAKPAATPTRTVVTGTSPEIVAYFRCTPTWFLFFQTGSICEFDRSLNLGQVMRLRTEACEVAAAQ